MHSFGASGKGSGRGAQVQHHDGRAGVAGSGAGGDGGRGAGGETAGRTRRTGTGELQRRDRPQERPRPLPDPDAPSRAPAVQGVAGPAQGGITQAPRRQRALLVRLRRSRPTGGRVDGIRSNRRASAARTPVSGTAGRTPAARGPLGRCGCCAGSAVARPARHAPAGGRDRRSAGGASSGQALLRRPPQPAEQGLASMPSSGAGFGKVLGQHGQHHVQLVGDRSPRRGVQQFETSALKPGTASPGCRGRLLSLGSSGRGRDGKWGGPGEANSSPTQPRLGRP